MSCLIKISVQIKHFIVQTLAPPPLLFLSILFYLLYMYIHFLIQKMLSIYPHSPQNFRYKAIELNTSIDTSYHTAEILSRLVLCLNVLISATRYKNSGSNLSVPSYFTNSLHFKIFSGIGIDLLGGNGSVQVGENKLYTGKPKGFFELNQRSIF